MTVYLFSLIRDQFQSVDIRHHDIGDDKGGSVLLEEFPEPPPHYKLPEPDIRKRVSVISQTMSL